MQVPPMYSALKVNGKKLYELAREGKTVERKARPVFFYGIEIQKIALPLIKLTVTCSKGTYIRTLCSDIWRGIRLRRLYGKPCKDKGGTIYAGRSLYAGTGGRDKRSGKDIPSCDSCGTGPW